MNDGMAANTKLNFVDISASCSRGMKEIDYQSKWRVSISDITKYLLIADQI